MFSNTKSRKSAFCVRIFFMKINIYTDGSSLGNPGPGGFSAILIKNEGESILEIGGRENHTTNNRMELRAVIEILTRVVSLPDLQKIDEVVINTDSKYVMNGSISWINNWKKNGWRTANKKTVLNQDLWQELDRLNNLIKPKYKYVEGHSGQIFNERADFIATSFAKGDKVSLREV